MLRSVYIKFFFTAVATALFLFVLYFIPACFFTGLDESLLWVAEMKEKKQVYADREAGPRVLFYGGSATLLGVSAEENARVLGVPAFNMGLHARLGMNFLIQDAKKGARKGDTIVFLPEYELFNDDEEYSQMGFNYYRIFDLPTFRTIPLKKKARFLKFFIFQHPFDSFVNFLRYRHAKPGGTGYGSNNISEYGDQTILPDKIYSGASGGFSKMKVREPPALERLASFARWSEANGVRLIVSFANMAVPDDLHEPGTKRYLENLVSVLRGAGIEVLGAPEDFFYPHTYFTDTYYHMNPPGVQLRSRQLAERLKKAGVGR